MRVTRVVPLIMLALALLELTAPLAVGATITFEVYSDRAAFEARLGGAGAVRVVDFDDVDTSAVDPAPFQSRRYRGTKGTFLVGENGQFASRSFGSVANYTPSSPPNMYAPGGHVTTEYFYTGMQNANVAGVGVVFIDADDAANGPSSIRLRGDGFPNFTAPTVSGSNGSHVFQGLVAVDQGTNQPTPVIFEVTIVNGAGPPNDPSVEGVALDDLEFALPVSRGNVGEQCDNCLDDDGDQAVDRLDGECDAPADGGGTGLDIPGLGKAVLKCQQAGSKAGVAFVGAMEKALQSCIGAVLQCVQTDPTPTCESKAQTKCAAAKGKIDAVDAKLRGALQKGCSPVPDEASFAARGLGWDAERVDCLRYGVTLSQGSDAGECFVRQHRCRAEQLVSHENARALELATLGGLDLAADFSCIEAGADGHASGLGDAARGKVILKCQQAIAKAGATYAKNRQKLQAKCFDSIAKCVQLKPNDDGCITNAEKPCNRNLSTVFSPSDDPKGLGGKAKATIVKGCRSVAPADLLAPDGLGQGAFATQCQAIGVATLDTVADVAECLIAFHACRGDRLVQKQYPRALEFSDLID